MQTILSAYAVIYNDYNDRNEILLAMRNEKCKKDANKWEVIGGKIHFGESPKECLIREVREELGCKLKNIKLFDIYNYVNKDDKFQLVSIIYLAKIDGVPRINQGEISDLRWFTFEEAQKLDFAVNCKKRVEDYFLKGVKLNTL